MCNIRKKGGEGRLSRGLWVGRFEQPEGTSAVQWRRKRPTELGVAPSNSRRKPTMFHPGRRRQLLDEEVNELDLTDEPASVAPIDHIQTREYKPGRQREITRTMLAGIVMVGLVCYCVAIFCCVLRGLLPASELDRVHTIVTSLAGVAIGFYLGGRDKSG
jgi:hypothetical protein